MANNKGACPISYLDLFLVGILAAFLCLWRIEAGSFGAGDQTGHSKVVQEMVRDGHWWAPTKEGRPYLNKPPFKMWLATVPVQLLGESNFSYRVLDGFLGTLTALLVYWIGFSFAGRPAGLLSALALLGCNSFFFGHGVRIAVQDGMLLLLSTLAIYAGYLLIEETLGCARSRRCAWLAVIGGTAVGCAILTKHVAGLMPLIVIGVYLPLTGRLRAFLRRGWRWMLFTVSLAIGIPALYFVPRSLESRSFWQMIFIHETYKRATQGYHNIHAKWFYLQGIADDRLAVPPEILLLGLVLCLVQLCRTRGRNRLLIVVWAVVPVIMYSIARSRLFWYIMPALPGMSLAVGVFAAALFERTHGTILDWRLFRKRPRMAEVLFGVAFLAALFDLTRNTYLIGNSIAQPVTRKAPDLIVEHMRHYAPKNRDPGVVIYKDPKLAAHENLYWGMLGVTKTNSPGALREMIESGQHALVVTGSKHLLEVLLLGKAKGYVLFPPRYRRRQWMAVIAYGDTPLHPVFIPTDDRFAFYEIEPAFGLSPPKPLSEKVIRSAVGKSAGLILRGDLARNTLSTGIELTAAPTQSPLVVQVWLNSQLVGKIDYNSEGFQTKEISVAPGNWMIGENLLSFVAETDSNIEPLLYDSLRIVLKVPGSPQ